jgi:hypothetical protein
MSDFESLTQRDWVLIVVCILLVVFALGAGLYWIAT